MYAKLFSSITESSLWSEPKEVRLLFVTMIAKADQTGFVEASVPGLARVANLTVEETEFALEVLRSPDKYSKNPDNEGRRIINVPQGFMILNYEDYRARRNSEERQEYMRNYMKEYRNKSKQTVNNCKPPLAAVSHGYPPLAQAEAEAEAEADTDTEEKNNTLSVSEAESGRIVYSKEFEAFWEVYPKQRRTKKQEAYRKWKQALKRVDAGLLIQRATDYAASDQGQSEFAVMPSVWLNGAMWEDDPEAWKRQATTKEIAW
jgi:hypothetical protein